MAINFTDFSRQPLEDSPFNNLIESLVGGYKMGTMPSQLASEQRQRAADALKQEILNKFLPERERSEIANVGSSTNLNLENVIKQGILNKYLPQREPAEINEIIARGKYYEGGGGGRSTGDKSQMAYINSVQQDNPHLNDSQVREAANIYAQVGSQLSDGTPLAPLSPLTKMHLDRAIKSTTTSQQINQGNGAQQAEKEIDVLDKYSQAGLKPYGDTYMGYSPSQIADTFKTDKRSQEKLGKLVASQALQFEIAQQRIKLAQGQPGVTSTNELIDLSRQVIKSQYPRLSAAAREEASAYLTKALKEGSKARQAVGYSPSSLSKATYDASRPESKAESVGSDKVRVYFPDGAHVIPKRLLNEALESGATLSPGGE